MLPEFSVEEKAGGFGCPECKSMFIGPEACEKVNMADAELLFCPHCHIAIAVLVNAEEKRMSA